MKHHACIVCGDNGKHRHSRRERNRARRKLIDAGRERLGIVENPAAPRHKAARGMRRGRWRTLSGFQRTGGIFACRDPLMMFLDSETPEWKSRSLKMEAKTRLLWERGRRLGIKETPDRIRYLRTVERGFEAMCRAGWI